MSDGRLELVRTKAEQWAQELIDFGPYNTLLYQSGSARYTVDLTDADPTEIAGLVDGRESRLGRLLRDPTALESAVRAARSLRRRVVQLREEQGIEVARLARGIAEIRPANVRRPTSPRPLRAPLLLQPVRIEPRTADESDFSVTADLGVEANPVLLVALSDHFGIDLDVVELQRRIEGVLDEAASTEQVTAVFEELRRALVEHPHPPLLDDRTVVGPFSFEKLPMVQGLRTSGDLLAAHDVVAAAAGDADARTALRQAAARLPADRDPDQLTPVEEFLVLDADRSQHQATLAVARGHHVVVEGPPGTGKSQTIANIIASAAAAGRSVLFVTEKRAAIEAVTDRLARAGLADLVLDLHDDQSGRAVAAQVSESLAAQETALPPAVDELHRELSETRRALSQRDQAVHDPRPPWGMSAYEVQNALLGLPARVATTITIARADLRNLDRGTVQTEARELASFVRRGGSEILRGESVWSTANVPTSDAAEALLGRLDAVTGTTWRTAQAGMTALVARAGLRPPPDLASWQVVLALLADVERTVLQHGQAVYVDDLDAYCAAAVPAADRREFASTEGWWRRRTRRRDAYRRRRDGRCSRDVLAGELRAAFDERARWRSIAVDPAEPPTPVSALDDRPFTALRDHIAAIAMSVQLGPADRVPLDELGRHLQRLRADEQTLLRLPGFIGLREQFDRLGLGPVLAEVARRDADPDDAADILRYTWLHSLLNVYRLDTPVLAEFTAADHDARVDRFVDLDRTHLQRNAARVRRRVAARLRDTRDAYPTENETVVAQAKLKRRHLPVRRLVGAAEHVLLAARPCWAMSPIVVSRLLPAKRLFDMVVFDEASQVEPVDAMTSIMRGRQLVVAGDEKQLPPSDYFRTLVAGRDLDESEDDHGADDAPIRTRVSDFESILTCLAAFVPTRYTLCWHYRSEDERLIAFSNHWFYQDLLVTFPGRNRGTPLQMHTVDGTSVPGRGGLGAGEIDQVVALAAAHALERPDDTLGIITANVAHRDRIEAALVEAASGDDVLAGFRARMGDRGRRLFVKSLELVQGDERDVIILSMGRAKGVTGRLNMNLGPISRDGGERRINVAITRARRVLHVVSAFTHEDIPADYPKAGPRVLRAFLEHAATGRHPGEQGRSTDIELNHAERAVLRAMEQRGVPTVPQWGVSGYRIDFALADPDRPGRLVMAVEFDGDRHHRLDSVRDRDRLRQAHLEKMGWTFHRVWASSWFADPDGEADRIVNRWRQAVSEPASAAAATGQTRSATTTSSTEARDVGAPTGSRRRGWLPIEPGHPVDWYTDDELYYFAQWHLSDNRLLDRETRVREMSAYIGSGRRLGPKIRRRLGEALDRAQAADRSS